MSIKKAGGVVGRGQESTDTAYHQLVTNTLKTVLAKDTHPLRSEWCVDCNLEE